jgi:carboxymethylenebutenolidase
VRARRSIEDLALLRGPRLRRVDHRLNTSTTTGEFMPTKTLQIPTADGQADAFAAFPDRGERHPGVLIYTDAFGVRPVLRETARELAGHGYYVLVPNIYYRHGPAPVTELPEHIGEEIRPAVIAKLMPLIEAHTTEQILRDADAYLRFLTAQPEVSAGPAP